MCDFCVKHGEGKKWYLQARNYGEDLLSDVRRQKMIAGFFDDVQEMGKKVLSDGEKLSRAPRIVKAIVGDGVTRKMKRNHFGQVVPIEDVDKIFDIVNSVVRIPCICRKVTLGRDERYCFAVSVLPGGGITGLFDASYLNGPDTQGLEAMEKQVALDLMRDFEKSGLVHSVWTFITPFIGGICNCDRADCLAMRMEVGYGIKVMFKGEYVAQTDSAKCTACRACMRVCQFGALGYSAASKAVWIDAAKCYGCGLCRNACTSGAISLVDRNQIATTAKLW